MERNQVRTITVSNNTGSINGIGSFDIDRGIRKGFQRWIDETEAALGVKMNVQFEFKRNAKADYKVGSKTIFTGRRNGIAYHGRGLANVNGNQMWLHNGQIPGHQGNRDGLSYTWVPFTSQDQLAKIVCHEFGHNIGLRHVNDRECVMHSDAVAAPICKSEAVTFERRFGSTEVEPEPQPFNGLFEQGTVVDAVNIPIVGQGAIRKDGKWVHLNGQRIILLNATVHLHEEIVNCCEESPE